MTNVIPKGDSEFGGGPGLIQARNVANQHFDYVEEEWIIMASDINDPADPDPRRVGKPWAERDAEAPKSGTAPLPPLNSLR